MTARVREAGRLDHGDHVCAVFETPADHHRIMLDFVKDGLRAGDRVAYYTHTVDPSVVLFRLAADGLEAHAAAAAGQLVVRPAAETCLANLPFDPAGAVASLGAQVEAALGAGFAGLRLGGDMTWAARGVPEGDRLLEYEQLMTEMLDNRPALALCQYDGALLDSATADAAVGLHNRRLLAPPPPPPRAQVEMTADGLVLRGEFDLSNAPALVAAVDQLLADGGQAHVFVDELVFIDGQGAAQLMRLHRTPAPLVLHGAPAILRRILEVCWPEAEVCLP